MDDAKGRTDQDIVIGVLLRQRQELLDKVTSLEATVEKMLPFMPKDPPSNDDKPQ